MPLPPPLSDMVDMDDATRLIGDLHQKLADLDHKVAAYRQDMAAEFNRYSRQLLQDIPHEISAEVDRAVAASFDNYPALRPALVPPRDLPDSPPPPPTDDAGHLTETQSNPGDPRHPPPPSPKSTPPSVVPYAGIAALTSPDSAYDRERDRDFHGLFTPSYLPLLDSSHSPPAAANHSPTLSPTSKPATADDMGRRKSGQAMEQPSIQVSVAATQTPERPNHERRATDDTTSSGASEQSESKVPRSALRRTSTGSKPPASPRRVRFEFEGGEVLPTASPQSSEPSSVLSHTLANSRSPPPEDDSMSVASILGPDEDNGPPPKKVSSSQALRALSRAPLDSNTVWTVVNPDAQDKENGIMATSDSETSLQTNNTRQPASELQTPPKTTASEQHGRTPEPSGPASPEAVNRQRDDDDDDDDDSSSDDGFLAMAKPKSFANKRAILSPISRSPTRTASVPYSPTSDKKGSRNESKTFSGQRDTDEHEDEEEMFYFEGLSAPPKPRSRPAPILEEEEEEDDDEAQGNEPVAQTLYSTSPAVSIPKQPEPAIPAHLISGSVGSFRGRPVTMPVVKNPDVYQQAASLGDISSFIGGLDGRSGVDDGDLNSYRASVGQTLFSGTPRSLTERMMMEEAQSQRRKAAQRPH